LPIPTDTERLCGSWALVNWERFRAGAFLEHPLGPDPVGLLTYDPAGFVQVQMMARDRSLATYRNPRDIANAGLRDQALSEEPANEVARAYSTFAGYAGRFEVDEENRLIRHHLWTGIDPRMVAVVQVRQYTFVDNDTLLLDIKPYQVEGVEHSDSIGWRRADSAIRHPDDVNKQAIRRDV